MDESAQPRMGKTKVFGTDDAAVWNHLGCIELLFTELRFPIAIYVAIMIRCNLYEIEWQFALLEVSAPLGNEVGKTFGILAVRVAHVRTSLIEEDTLYAIVEDRVGKFRYPREEGRGNPT